MHFWPTFDQRWISALIYCNVLSYTLAPSVCPPGVANFNIDGVHQGSPQSHVQHSSHSSRTFEQFYHPSLICLLACLGSEVHRISKKHKL